MFTGDVYEAYKGVAKKCGCRTLTMGSVSEIITELDMLGLIQTKIISKGRYGRTREICLDLTQSTIDEINKILELGLNLKPTKSRKKK